MQNPAITPAITLEEAACQFQTWRANKKSKFDPMPAQLKSLVKKLIPYYSKNQIINTLKISQPQLNNIKNPQSNAKSTKQNLNFIPFKLVNSEDSLNLRSVSQDSFCEIIKSNGTKLIIHNPDIQAIVQAFLCCN